MSMIQLAYVSCPIATMTLHGVMGIVSQSRSWNLQHEITGCLLYRPKTFIQIIEGRRAVVTQAFGRIVSDTRHTDVELLGVHDIKERVFSKWSMAYIALQDVDPGLAMKYAASTDFEHSELNFDSVIKLARRLSEEVEPSDYVSSAASRLSHLPR